ncbi:OFA family MFS transporter [Paraburkholderia aspalathi]|uniref:OFA family MFS transporter n=1 Tax=Paraburkholderia aspalathi TaxID=1324617 RepID=UPI0038BA5EAA
MAMLGTLYSWSLISQALIDGFGWPHTQATAAFSWAVFFVGVGALAGGRWQDKAGPRIVTLTGVALWGTGNMLAGLGTARFGPLWLYLTYGVVGGLGVGLGYVTPVATAIKWFPDRPGLAGGLVAAGFGLGAVVYDLIATAVPAFSAATADHAIGVPAPEHARAALAALTWLGIALLVFGLPCASFVRNPPVPVTVPACFAACQSEGSFTTAEMLRTPQFFLLWLMFFTNVAAGILLIANVVPITEELSHATPLIAARIYAVAAVANAAGRLFWGAVSDRIGHNSTYALLFGIQAVAFFAIGGLHDVAGLALALAVVLLCFGGAFGVMPSFNTRYFGTAHMGANYGVLLTAWGCAGIAGPLLAAKAADIAGSFAHALDIEAAVLVAAILLPSVNRPPRRSRRQSDAYTCIEPSRSAFHSTD